MKIKLDENIPNCVFTLLMQRGYSVDTVMQEGLGGRRDNVVWQAAQQDGRFFITQDLDFTDINKFKPGTHHGLMIIRLGEPGKLAILNRITSIIQNDDLQKWQSSLIVVTDKKIRVRSP